MKPRAPSRSGAARLAVLVVGAAAMVAAALSAGCSSAKHHRVLSLFFDGVPEPQVEVASDAPAAQASLGRQLVRGRRARPLRRQALRRLSRRQSHERPGGAGRAALRSLPRARRGQGFRARPARLRRLSGLSRSAPLGESLSAGIRLGQLLPAVSRARRALGARGHRGSGHAAAGAGKDGSDGHAGDAADCTDCHDAHMSDRKYLLREGG